ncbi:MAG: AAA family ATPase, partial [Raineya sp.]|nr:AAA family ATPase [Raineya sp.]
MAKTKTTYFCQSCGYQSPKWLGKCPSCQQWNTFVEEILEKSEPTKGEWKSSTSTKISNKPKLLSEVDFEAQPRLLTPDKELNRVLGGGIVAGSLVLIGGEPGIGKSTLMLQIALGLQGKRVLYISGEEIEQQIKMRAERLEQKGSECYLLCETSTQNIFKQIENLEPDIVIVDSIQTL